jgi:hypothetical protein
MEGYIYFLIFIVLILVLNLKKSIQNLIKQYLSEFFTVIGTIGLAIVSLMSNSDKKFISLYTWEDSSIYLLLLFGILLLLAVIIGAKRNQHNRSVQSEIEKNISLIKSIESYKKEYYKLCSTNIFYLFEPFYTTGNERISIYKYHGDHFSLLGRYSKNPAHNKVTTYKYTENEGLIGKGWAEGECIITNAPKWVGNGTEYKKFMKKHCTITEKRLKKIRMKSQSLFIKTLHDNNTAENPDGIIVFESISPTKVTKEECEKLIKENSKEIFTLLKNMKSLTKMNK